MDLQEKIVGALASLDPKVDDHWTSDNLPRLDVIRAVSGTEATRADINSAAKGFNRKNPIIPGGPQVGGQEPEPDPIPEEPIPEELPVLDLETDPTVDKMDLAIEAAYKKSQRELLIAQQKYQQSRDAMDSVIARREKDQKKQSQAEAVKAYQKSQFNQRLARARAGR